MDRAFLDKHRCIFKNPCAFFSKIASGVYLKRFGLYTTFIEPG